ncbi:MAG: hypothetical protein HY926_04265 [Elusimicrobia bacterium]|nr:hypothetical protein [Elusimicrobiota bacterium]
MAENSALCEKVKNAVVAGLKDDPQAAESVGPLILQIVTLELKQPGATTRAVLVDCCLGAMRGLVLIEKDLPAGAVAILKALAHLVQERSGDPMKTMSYAVEGLAYIASVVQPDALHAIATRLEAEIMGTGQEFSSFVEKQRKGG